MHKINEILNLEFFIARRLASSPDEGRRNVMVRIATATVAIGVAVMIVALAVITGFKREITEKIIGFGAHVQVVNLDGNSSFERAPILRSTSLEERVRALPLAASRRSPPDGPFCNPPDPKDARGHRDLSKSPRAAFPGAHVPGSQAAPRSERWTAQSSSASQAARGRA